MNTFRTYSHDLRVKAVENGRMSTTKNNFNPSLWATAKRFVGESLWM